MKVDLTDVDAVLRVLQSPACVVFMHSASCAFCLKFKPTMQAMCEKYERVPVYYVDSDVIQKYRRSNHNAHNFIATVDAFPTTVLSNYGHDKTTLVGAVNLDKAEAFFKEALASMNKDTLLPCAITQAEVDYFKHEQGHGAVIRGPTMPEIRQLLPVNNSTRVNCIALISGAGGSRAEVLEF
jgi:hypothetical protein